MSQLQFVARLQALWRWLTGPQLIYPNPPIPRDENAAGVGWAGDRRQFRPFEGPQ